MRLQALGLNQQEDSVFWKRENDDFREGFSSSQTWNLNMTQAPKVSWFKAIWFKEATFKFSFLTWLAVHNRLSTWDRILRWNPQAVSTCWLCNSVSETTDHLFFECSFAGDVWRGTIRNLAGVEISNRWNQLMQRLGLGLQDRSSTFLFRYCFQTTVYAIWRQRNTHRVGEALQYSSCGRSSSILGSARLIILLNKFIRNRILSLRKIAENKYEKTMEIWFGNR